MFQPIVSLESGRISGLEALVRWQHPDRGLVAPGEFIEIAEENGRDPPDEFVQVAEGDERSAALAGAIVALGESLGIATVAEGIKTKPQAERMRSLGCTYGQGYFFAKPVTAAEIEAGIEGLASPLRWEAEGKRAPRRRRATRATAPGSAAA